MNIDVDLLPDDWTLLEAVVCYKALDPQGRVRFGSNATSGLMRPEAIGLMHLMIAEQTHNWVLDPGDDDD